MVCSCNISLLKFIFMLLLKNGGYMQIKIFTRNQFDLIEYTIDKETISVNNAEKKCNTDDYIYRICNLVRDWPKFLENSKIIDGFKIKIEIEKNDETDVYFFNNKFPNDFFLFMRVLDEIKNNIKN